MFVNRLYGFSPVEQITLTVNIGLRRQISQLQYFTDGTIPDVFLEAPEGLSEDRMTQFETLWNEKFASTAARRKGNFIPFGAKVTFAKDPKLKDELDEYLARQIAYAFSVSPTALVKMVNRAAGQQMAEDAKAEGLEPILYWFKEFMDDLLEFMGCGDIEFSWETYTRENPLQQAQINQIYLSTIDDQGPCCGDGEAGKSCWLKITPPHTRRVGLPGRNLPHHRPLAKRSDITSTWSSQAWFRQPSPNAASRVLVSEKWV